MTTDLNSKQIERLKEMCAIGEKIVEDIVGKSAADVAARREHLLRIGALGKPRGIDAILDMAGRHNVSFEEAALLLNEERVRERRIAQLSLLPAASLCEMIVGLERSLREERRAHAREIENLMEMWPRPKRPWWRYWG